MITPVDNQAWQRELVTGNAQFVEVGSTIYIVSQVRADNTFAVFKSVPTPPAPGAGFAFTQTAEYAFPTTNVSFDPVIAYDSGTQLLYIVGTQSDGTNYDVIFFAYNTGTDTLGSPATLVTASYVRDSYDVCTLQYDTSPPTPANVLVAVAVTNPVQIWSTPTVVEVASISIAADVLTVYGTADFPSGWVGKNITLSGLQNAIFLNGATVEVTSVGMDGNGSFFTADYNYDDYAQEGYESGFATWLPGHSLLGIELMPVSSPPFGLVGITVIDSSPFSSGNTFGSVSAYSPACGNIEVYYESHPKLITFTDQTFTLNLATRVSEVWSASPIMLPLSPPSPMTFTARYADARLTVIPVGSTRILLQQYYSQLVHRNALVGNLMTGYYDGASWQFHVQSGSPANSYIEGTLSTSDVGTFVSYLVEPVYDVRGAWSPQVGTYAVNDRVSYNTASGDSGWVDYIVNQAVTYAYAGAWNSDTYYAAGSVVLVTLPTNPATSVYYTAVNAVAYSSVSPNLDTVNWTPTLTPNLDSRFTVAPASWPLHTASLNLTSFNLTDIPGFYNTLNFSWLRGCKSILDSETEWAIVGEQTGLTQQGATFVSGLVAPPVVVLNPSGYTTVSSPPVVFSPPAVTSPPVLVPWTVLRGAPFPLDASLTNNGDTSSLEFTWTLSNAVSQYIHLTPNASGTQATLLIDRAIGGSSFTIPLLVGVVAVDYSGSTPLHPPMTIAEIAVAACVATITASAPVDLAIGEAVFFYGIPEAPTSPPTSPPLAPSFLNDRVGYVQSVDGSLFTVAFTDGLPTPDFSSVVDAGYAIANQQFGFVAVDVLYNPAPTIDFTHDAFTHEAVAIPIEAARNSTVTINPTYTGVNDPDDDTSYAWLQISGTVLPSSQILSGLSEPSLQFDDSGGTLEEEAFVWQLVVDDEVNPPVTSTVEVDVQAYPFVYADSLLLSRTIWGVPSSPPVVNAIPYLLTSPPTSPPATSPPAATIANIALRNTAQNYAPLDVSTLYTNFDGIKRNSVIDGSDRYLIISNASVTVYGGVNPSLRLLRKLLVPAAQQNIVSISRTDDVVTVVLSGGFTSYATSLYLLIAGATQSEFNGLQLVTPVTSPPSPTSTTYTFPLAGADVPSSSGGIVTLQPEILDAVHTEVDYTLVLDDTNNLYRYSGAPLITTDAPDTTINLTGLTAQVFNKVFSTTAFGGYRIVVLTGQDGMLLLQLRSTDLSIQGMLEFTVASGLLYGVDNVQFVRTSNVEGLNTGKVLIGTIVSLTADISSVTVDSDNTVVIAAPNTFVENQVVTFAGLTNALFLNGVKASVTSATPAQFVISYLHEDYATTPEPAGAVATTGGATYETLIDLSTGQIIGTWDASRLINQFVTTGEILFEPNDTYAGVPSAPIMNPVVNNGVSSVGYVNLAVSWSADRPDLISSYGLGTSQDNLNWTVTTINNGSIESILLTKLMGQTFYFRVQAFSVDGVSPYSNVVSIRT